MTVSDPDSTANTDSSGGKVAPPTLPSGWRGYARQIGPGIFAAMTLLGSGELVDVAVAGGNYGYALLWGFALVLLSKFFFMFMTSKYQLLNTDQLTIMQGFAKLGKPYPLLTGLGLFLGIFAYGSFYFPAAGTALAQLAGFGGEDWARFIGALATLILAVVTLKAKKLYQAVENVSRLTILVLALTFLFVAIAQAPAVGEFLRGFLFSLPADTGVFGSILIIVALVGVAGVTPAAIVYNYAIYEKGWRSHRYRKVQVLDLLVAITGVAIIDFSIWAVAAENAHGKGFAISGVDDLSRLMHSAVGTIGPPLLWIAVFFASFSSIIGTIFLFSRTVVDAIHNAFPTRRDRYGKIDRDPIVKWLSGLGLTLPIVFATPWAPSTVVLAVVAVTIPLISTPVMLLGTFRLTASAKFLPQRFVRKWQSAVLLVLIVLAVASLGGAAVGLYSTIATIFG
ncbi:Nramp family divalent metal transporter [Pseudonocardia sp. C8]|uniref:Nramp family divalent metal transporter n=1 Tax=Pseudonocardia sp. C8 TaxID=2762759 RepID=UPI0016435E48|nr:Nramp family divalent metal transporter [Pseudonocardia sp. C8]MBC3189555.1 Nramp family divalent metal transporter [Pseudonocardia sp. C8]